MALSGVPSIALRRRFAPARAAVPEVTVILPELAAYDALRETDAADAAPAPTAEALVDAEEAVLTGPEPAEEPPADVDERRRRGRACGTRCGPCRCAR